MRAGIVDDGERTLHHHRVSSRSARTVALSIAVGWLLAELVQSPLLAALTVVAGLVLTSCVAVARRSPARSGVLIGGLSVLGIVLAATLLAPLFVVKQGPILLLILAAAVVVVAVIAPLLYAGTFEEEP